LQKKFKVITIQAVFKIPELQTIRAIERLKQSLTTPFVVSLDTMRAQARMAELRERLRNEIISIRLMLDTSKV
ncbi:hypothetical protein, partial [Paenibacillus sp. 598K]|uniref:hypothetical protein n=1 Tax=Paenibacillus sp. 598K TaxID=1117987 RepID=UPI001C87D2DA